jgi:hypothetical protein
VTYDNWYEPTIIANTQKIWTKCDNPKDFPLTDDKNCITCEKYSWSDIDDMKKILLTPKTVKFNSINMLSFRVYSDTFIDSMLIKLGYTKNLYTTVDFNYELGYLLGLYLLFGVSNEEFQIKTTDKSIPTIIYNILSKTFKTIPQITNIDDKFIITSNTKTMREIAKLSSSSNIYKCNGGDYLAGLKKGLSYCDGVIENKRVKEIYYWIVLNLNNSRNTSSKDYSETPIKDTKFVSDEYLFGIEVDCQTHSFVANNIIMYDKFEQLLQNIF